jgi:predicted dehydrogenase
MTDKIGVAVIGAGIGAEHVKGYLENADRYRVAVVCDLDAARAARAAGLCGADVEAGYASTLARRDIDLVDICLPPHLHLSAIEQALASGRHVLCEKPLVGGLEEVERVARMAERVGRSVTPVYQYRYGEGFRRLKRLIDRGLAGRPLVASLETHWDRGPG